MVSILIMFRDLVQFANARDADPVLSSSVHLNQRSPFFLSSLFFLSRVPFSLAGPALSESGFHGRGEFQRGTEVSTGICDKFHGASRSLDQNERALVSRG